MVLHCADRIPCGPTLRHGPVALCGSKCVPVWPCVALYCAEMALGGPPSYTLLRGSSVALHIAETALIILRGSSVILYCVTKVLYMALHCASTLITMKDHTLVWSFFLPLC